MICPNCGAPVCGKRCEYCGTWFVTEPEREEVRHREPAKKEEDSPCEWLPAARRDYERPPVFSRECGQKTDVAFPEDPLRSNGGVDSFLFFIVVYLVSMSFVFVIIGPVMVVILSVVFLVWVIAWVMERNTNYEKDCDAEALWDFYQQSPADAEKQYFDQWLGLTVYFSGFLNNPVDGTLVAGCASYRKDGTEFELVFFRNKGKEHLVPGQTVRILGRCKGLQEGRLRLEGCSVLEVSDP